MTTARVTLIGVGLLVAALVVGAIPHSEEYSDFGFGVSGQVTVKCGSVFSRDQEVEFRDFAEGQQYRAERASFREPRIFDGQTETEVCDDQLKGQRTLAILAALTGAGLLGFARWKKLQQPSIVPDEGSAAAPSGSDSAGAASEVAPANTDATASPATPSFHVRVSTGDECELSTTVVIGRNPVAPCDRPEGALLACDDPTMTLSKTHLIVGLDHGQLWVEDLYSLDGTRIVSGDSTRNVEPDVRALLRSDDRIEAGAHTIEVISKPGDADNEVVANKPDSDADLQMEDEHGRDDIEWT